MSTRYRSQESRLLFLHIDKFRALSKADFCLDPAYDIEYDNGNRVISIEKRNDFPANFYDLGTRKSRSVKSVAALIGMNGSGKTTVANLLQCLAEGFIDEIRGIIIVAIESGELVCRTTIKGLRVASDLHCKQFDFTKRNFTPPEDIYYLYINPHAVARGPVQGQEEYLQIMDIQRSMTDRVRFIDKSSSGIMARLAAECEENGRISGCRANAAEMFVDRESSDFFRTYIELNVSRSFKEGDLDSLLMPNAKGVVVKAYEPILNCAYRVYCRRNNNTDWKFLSLVQNADLFVRVFLAYVCAYCKDLDDDDVAVASEYFSYRDRLLDFCKANIRKERLRSIAALKSLRSDIVSFFEEEAGKIHDISKHEDNKEYNFFALLEEFVGVSPVGDAKIINVPFRDGRDVEGMLTIIHLYYELKGRYDFIVFEPSPCLSAGAMAYMSIFSRMYTVLQDWEFAQTFDPVEFSYGFSPSRDPRHVLIFLDEAETALHPELQRKLVRNLILFLEMTRKKNLTVQLVFASHSPMLLSDIPKASVTILNLGRTLQLGKIPDKTLGNTFAANIFDLYARFFELYNGTFGSFAAEKINALLQKKLGGESFSPDDDKLAKMIGDNYFRRFLTNS